MAYVAISLFETSRTKFFLFEIVLLISVVLSSRLINQLTAPSDFLEVGVDQLNAGEFSTRIRPVGLPEVDQLISVYNQMIDRLHRAQLDLGEKRGFLEKLLEATPAAIMTLDFDGKLSTLNAAALNLIGGEGAELVGKRLSDLDLPLATSLAKLEQGTSKIINYQGFRRLNCRHSGFIDRGFSRSFYIVEDLTQELHESERSAYENLVRMVSHEVNNTVGASNSLLESCRAFRKNMNESDQADFIEAIDIVTARNESLNQFVRKFAQVVKIPELVKSPVDLNELLTDIAKLITPMAKEHGVSVEFVGDTTLAAIRLDRHLMDQALLNIAKNAVEATPENGSVMLRTAVQNQQIVVEICDSGDGLQKDGSQMMFSPFFTTKPSGQGLGLVLVSEVLSRHECEFSLTSEQGFTVFRIRFPKT